MMGSYDNTHWAKCPWNELVQPARKLFWEYWPGHMVVKTGDVERNPEHNTRMLRIRPMLYPSDILVPFYTLTSATYRIENEQATGERIRSAILQAMGEFIDGFLKARDYGIRELVGLAHNEDIHSVGHKPIYTRVYFLENNEPNICVDTIEGGVVRVKIFQEMGHTSFYRDPPPSFVFDPKRPLKKVA